MYCSKCFLGTIAEEINFLLNNILVAMCTANSRWTCNECQSEKWWF